MTGDRRLTEQEKAFELATHRFNALETVKNSGGEPSLFELAIIEISAKLDSHSDFIIDMGAKLQILENEVKRLGGKS